MRELSGLYYPFSRCVNAASLKRMLLVFDDIAFVDPVDDDSWRKKLIGDLEALDHQFSDYREIDPSLPALLEEGCIRRIDPATVSDNTRNIATASALSDLQDGVWTKAASSPQKSNLPAFIIDGKKSWQIFRPKLPLQFINSMKEIPAYRSHLLREGSDWASWSLSYAAGSAISIGLHLEIAEELGLSPITDSPLHHRLLLMKVARAAAASDTNAPIPGDVIRQLTARIATTMLSTVLPDDKIEQVHFEEILLFREKTRAARHQFINDVETRLGTLRTPQSSEEWITSGTQVLKDLRSEFQVYQAEFAASRDKVWPGIMSSFNGAVIPGGVAAVAISYIGGPGKALIGSLVGAAIVALKTALDLRAEGNKLAASSAPSTAYLSRVAAHIM